MRRRNAYLLIGGLLLSIVGYICWAARPFLIRPSMEFSSDMPAKEKKIVNDWIKETGGYGPESFNWGRYLNLLIHPYEKAVLPAVAEFHPKGDRSYSSGHIVRIIHPHKAYHVRIVVDDINNHDTTTITFH